MRKEEGERGQERPGEGHVSRGKQAHRVHPKEVQVYLGDIAGLVPDHCNKVNTAIKQITQIFWFLSAYKSYVYTIL